LILPPFFVVQHCISPLFLKRGKVQGNLINYYFE
jgi:hypothetical protein